MDLMEILYSRCGLELGIPSGDIEKVIRWTLKNVSSELSRNSSVEIAGWGTFNIREEKRREEEANVRRIRDSYVRSLENFSGSDYEHRKLLVKLNSINLKLSDLERIKQKT